MDENSSRSSSRKNSVPEEEQKITPKIDEKNDSDYSKHPPPALKRMSSGGKVKKQVTIEDATPKDTTEVFERKISSADNKYYESIPANEQDNDRSETSETNPSIRVNDKELEDEKEDKNDKENEEYRSVHASPDSRFLKFNQEIGRGSFKTVYKGLDTETGVQVAWCELQVKFE